MRRILYILTSATILLASCIKNDVPYPVVALNILGVEGEGFKVYNIDEQTRVVTLELDETTDLRNVHITAVKTTDKAELSIPLVGTFDMRTPIYVTLSLYQKYEWSIVATQTIERRFGVEGQIGATEFDLENRTAKAFVSRKVDLKHINVTELKLGPQGITTTTPTMAELADADFSTVRLVDATWHGQTERWMLYVEQTDDLVALVTTDLWNNTATFGVVAQPSAKSVVLNYKKSIDTEWQPTTIVKNDDDTYTATITPMWTEGKNAAGFDIYTVDHSTGVAAGFTYDYQLLVDGAVKATGQFETDKGNQIADGDMENSALSCFSISNEVSNGWGSGNNSIKKGLCTQSTFAGMGGAKCAKLTASATLGILASGNLFQGTFVMKNMNGTVGFGQKYAYNARPAALSVKCHATIGIVDIQKNYGGLFDKDSQDRARIFVCVVDWSARKGVTSGTSKPTGMWDPDNATSIEGCGEIIGYGSQFIDTTQGQSMETLNIPIQYYKKTNAAPEGNYTLIVSVSTSAYGDYMNGCSTNVMYIDDFELKY